MKRFEGMRVAVSGAGSGIGRAAALMFAEEGAEVAVLDSDAGAGRETAELLKDAGGSGRFLRVDVSKAQDVSKGVSLLLGRWGRIDVLCNNAGTVLVKMLHETSEKEWDLTAAVNLKGTFLMSRGVIPSMMERGKGAIVNVSSISGILGWPSYAAYCAAKGGIVQLTRQMAVDYAPFGIRVNCVCPGTTETPMIERLLSREENPAESRRTIEARHPLGRFAKPEEIAHAILFLASDEASFVTGVSLPVDGGYTAK